MSSLISGAKRGDLLDTALIGRLRRQDATRHLSSPASVSCRPRPTDLLLSVYPCTSQTYRPPIFFTKSKAATRLVQFLGNVLDGFILPELGVGSLPNIPDSSSCSVVDEAFLIVIRIFGHRQSHNKNCGHGKLRHEGCTVLGGKGLTSRYA